MNLGVMRMAPTSNQITAHLIIKKYILAIEMRFSRANNVTNLKLQVINLWSFTGLIKLNDQQIGRNLATYKYLPLKKRHIEKSK